MAGHLARLTPREREVLAFIRLGLTNEEIAQRLDISLAGAKYHVSQILSKLGVATREEAAGTLAERRPWWARWPLWAKIAGAATVAAAVVGLALLAWGTWRTSGQGEPVYAEPIGGPNEGPAACVQGDEVNSDVQARAAGLIREALAEVDAVRASLTPQDNVPDNVSVGCPVGPELRVKRDCPPFEQLGGFFNLCGRRVKQPGRYTVLIYVLPQDEIDEIVGRAGNRLSSEETMSEGDVAWETGVGLYLGEDEIGDPDYIRLWIYLVTGFDCYIPDDLMAAPPTPAVSGYSP